MFQPNMLSAQLIRLPEWLPSTKMVFRLSKYKNSLISKAQAHPVLNTC